MQTSVEFLLRGGKKKSEIKTYNIWKSRLIQIISIYHSFVTQMAIPHVKDFLKPQHPWETTLFILCLTSTKCTCECCFCLPRPLSSLSCDRNLLFCENLFQVVQVGGPTPIRPSYVLPKGCLVIQACLLQYFSPQARVNCLEMGT